MDSVCALVIGMAGSGKTTFLNQFQQLSKNFSKSQQPAFTMNLDPAVYYLPYQPTIDIRKHIDYKKTMKDQGLG